MTYTQFLAIVKANGFSMAQLRCDVPPSEAILDLIDTAGVRYERFVLRFQSGK